VSAVYIHLGQQGMVKSICFAWSHSHLQTGLYCKSSNVYLQ